MSEAFVRFLIGGLVVSAFATSGAFSNPRASPDYSAPRHLSLSQPSHSQFRKTAEAYAGTECRSMMAGAAGLCLYSILVSQLLARFRLSALTATLSAMPLWFLTAFGLWRIFLK